MLRDLQKLAKHPALARAYACVFLAGMFGTVAMLNILEAASDAAKLRAKLDEAIGLAATVIIDGICRAEDEPAPADVESDRCENCNERTTDTQLVDLPGMVRPAHLCGACASVYAKDE